MSELRLETLSMDAAPIGPPSPHPQFRAPEGPNEPRPERIDPGVAPEAAATIGYGKRSTALPYKLQDDLSRERAPRDFDVAVLENEHLRATFLLGYGGRLWSLEHKATGRELLHRNPVFQPGNLAIRVAWLSGGVEWNFGWRGHSPLTCEPLFAARARLDDGTPVLRLYEYERERGLPFQVDCFLPAGSPVLLVRVAIRNPDARTVPVYWWSNMAVPEVPGGRVLVPAESLFNFDYGSGWMRQQAHPLRAGVDRSYPEHIPVGNDDFYYVPDNRQPWIASLDRDGSGLFQASSSGLRGRKLFVWGQLPGSRGWQDFLNTPGHAYVEIQAGLERTQGSCMALPGGGELEWIEAYGLVEGDAEVVHGMPWSAAWKHVDALIARQAAEEELERMLVETRPMSLAAPEALLQRGSGWGALERRRRTRAGEAPLCGPALPFGDETLGDEQAPWLALLEGGALPSPPPLDEPSSYMCQPQWRRLLADALAAGDEHWYTRLQLGVMELADGELDAATDHWRRSLALAENPWARRNLGQVAAQAGDHATARAELAVAVAQRPADWRLTQELARVLLDAGEAQACFDLLLAAPAAVRARRRSEIMLLEAAVELERFDLADAIVADEALLPDAFEGDRSISDLWFRYRAKALARERGEVFSESLLAEVRATEQPPRHLDYRMADV